MKLQILILLFSLSCIHAFGQDIYDQQDSVIYVTAKDEALLLDKETKFVFKTNPLSFEVKVGKSFSVIPHLGDLILSPRKVGVETRYYHNMARRIREGRQASNISGRYISAIAKSGFENTEKRSLDLGLNYGFQQRILNREYFDMGLSVRYSVVPDTTLTSGAVNSIGIGTFMRYGFMFGKKQSIDPNSTCSLIKCHNNRKSAWKLRLNDLVSISRKSGYEDTDPFWLFSANPQIVFEQKILNSSFSLEQELQSTIRLGYNNRGYVSIPALGIEFRNSFSYVIGSKYYYKMAKKVLEGTGGNNLSGPYLFVRAKHTQFTGESDGFTHFGIGKQRELFGNIILEFNFFGIIRNYGEEEDVLIERDPIRLDFKMSYIIK